MYVYIGHIMNNFDWKFYLDTYPELKESGITNKLSAKQHFMIHGKNENRRTHKIVHSNTIISKLCFYTFLSLAKQAYVSDGLSFFRSKFYSHFNLDNYSDPLAPSFFFGIYTDNDLNLLKNHKNLKIVIWGGSDCDPRFKHCEQTIKEVKLINNVIHLSTSECLFNRLKQVSINSIYVNFNMVDTNIFKKISNTKTQKNIYIYNGKVKGREQLYGNEIYNLITEKYKDITFIFSNTLNLPCDKMPDVYQTCFLGMRLTKYDGNANTVQEFEAMGIPIIHNQSDYGLKWSNIETIVNYIESLRK